MVNILASTPTDDNGLFNVIHTAVCCCLLFVVVNVFVVHQLEKICSERDTNDIVPLCH